MPIKNKGTGAGGSNTNKSGKGFEEKISLEKYLIQNDFEKNNITKKNIEFSLSVPGLKLTYMKQNTFRYYMKKKYNEKVIRVPDEIIILEKNGEKPILFIIEIKNQNVEGSVETKLWACDGLLYEYSSLYNNIFDVNYCIVVNNFLKNKFEDKKNIKYKILKSYFAKREIKLFYGEDIKYNSKLINFVLSFV